MCMCGGRGCDGVDVCGWGGESVQVWGVGGGEGVMVWMCVDGEERVQVWWGGEGVKV